MIDNEDQSLDSKFHRTFTCLRYGPQALSGLRLLSLFLSSVGKNSRLYSAKSTLVSTVRRECCMSGSSVSTDMKNNCFMVVRNLFTSKLYISQIVDDDIYIYIYFENSRLHK